MPDMAEQGGAMQGVRLLFLDWLRILAFGVLVIYHVGMVYVGWAYHVKSPFAGPALEPWMKLSEPWRMSLLFMLSGAVTTHMLRGSGGVLQRVRRRSRQLLLPLLLGVALIVPPQSYVHVMQQYGYTGSFLDFMRLYATGYRGFCHQGLCLVLPTWNHLWFLAYLWIYTLLLCAVLAAWPNALAVMAKWLRHLTAGPLLLIVPVGLILILRVTLCDRFPSTHALWGDWFNHALYFGMFASGALFAMPEPLWDRLMAWRWPAFVAALAAWAVLVTAAPTGVAGHAAVAVELWGALVAAFGFARRHLDVDHPWRRTLNEAVFPVYLVHQTVIVVGAWLLFPLGWHPGVEAVVLVAATFVLSLAVVAAVRPVAWLRPWFGLPKASVAPPAGDVRPVVDPR